MCDVCVADLGGLLKLDGTLGAGNFQYPTCLGEGHVRTGIWIRDRKNVALHMTLNLAAIHLGTRYNADLSRNTGGIGPTVVADLEGQVTIEIVKVFGGDLERVRFPCFHGNQLASSVSDRNKAIVADDACHTGTRKN